MSNAVLLTANTAKKPAFLNTREEMTREKEAVSGNAGAKSARPAPARAAAGAATAQPVAVPSVAGTVAAPGVASDTVRSEPSTTIPTSSQAAWGAVEKARNELTEITNTYSRLRQVYSLAPFKGQSLFAGILNSSRAEIIGTRLSDATRAKYKMEAIASGNEQVILDVRRESGEAKAVWAKQEAAAKRTAAPQAVIAQEAEPKPQEVAVQPGAPKAQGPVTDTPKPEGTVEEAPVADDSVDLIDYLRRRYFWPLANEIYNTVRDLYVRRDIRVDNTLAFRSCFEADEDEGFFSSLAKYASTLGTRKEALKHIDRIQGYYFPKVPPHVTGEATRHLLIPDAIKNLNALDRSHLPELQESYFTVSNDKDSALDTAVFLKDALEVTKAASEMVISTGTTILTGGNPAAEALVSGLYSGALSFAEQASSSSVAEGEFKKAKRELDASGLDPSSPEYQQTLKALQDRREASEVNWKKVAFDATVSAALSAAPGVGKRLARTGPGRWVKGRAGDAAKWAMNTGAGKAITNFGSKVSKKLIDPLSKTAGKFKDKIGTFFGEKKKGLGEWIKNLRKPKAPKPKPTGKFAEFRQRVFETLTKKRTFRDTGLGKSITGGYHKLFDRFSDKAMATKELERTMNQLIPGFDKSGVSKTEMEKFLQKAMRETKGKDPTTTLLAMKEARERLIERSRSDAFETALSKGLVSKEDKAGLMLYRALHDSQGLSETERRAMMEQAWKRANALMAGAGRDTAEQSAGLVAKDKFQEDVAKALQTRSWHSVGISDDTAFSNAFALARGARDNKQIAEYVAARDFFRETSEQGFKYAALASGQAGVKTYGSDVLGPAFGKAKDKVIDILDDKAKKEYGISVKNPIGISLPGPSDVIDGMKDDLVKHLGNEIEGKEDDYDLVDSFTGQFFSTEGTALGKLVELLSKEDDSDEGEQDSPSQEQESELEQINLEETVESEDDGEEPPMDEEPDEVEEPDEDYDFS